MEKQKISPARIFLLLAIIVSVGAALGFLLAIGKIGKINLPVAINPVGKRITISTDKTEYEQGEMVKITAQNNLAKEIRFEIGFIAPFTSLFIEKYENGKWREFSEVYGSAEITPDFTPYNFLKDSKKLGPTEKLNYEFDLWHRQEYDEGYKAGKYRIKLNYYYFDEISQNTNWDEFNNLQHTAYSNEFTIKEKTTDTLKINLDGYIKSCITKPSVFIKENGVWREANTSLPAKGMYFLDGKYYGYGMCDVVMCDKIPDSFSINLIEYKKIGEKESLETKGYMVPEYQTAKLNGEVRVELKYFTDNKCENEKSFSTIVNTEKSAIDPRCGGKVEFNPDCAIATVVYGYEFDSIKEKCKEINAGGGCDFKTLFNAMEECRKVCETSAGKEIPFETIIKGFNSNQAEKKNYVIKNEGEWAGILTETGAELPAPVDFTKDMIIAVFQGVKMTGGYGIEITKIIETDNNIEVYIKETSPGPKCNVTQAITNPYHIVKLAKSDKEIKFNTTETVNNCEAYSQ